MDIRRWAESVSQDTDAQLPPEPPNAETDTDTDAVEVAVTGEVTISRSFHAFLHANGYNLEYFPYSSELTSDLEQLIDRLELIAVEGVSIARSVFPHFQPGQLRERITSQGFDEAAFCLEDQSPEDPLLLHNCRETIQRAYFCLRHDYDASTWNMIVNSYVLRLVFREELPSGEPPLSNVFFCPSSDMRAAYEVNVPLRGKADFYITLTDREYDLRHMFADMGFPASPLTAGSVGQYPLAIPVTVAAASGDKTQVWHELANMLTAQWLWLQGLHQAAPPNLSFLLGIVVEDYLWYMGALVPSEGDTTNTVLIKLPLGSTRNLATVYKLLLSLELLREWTEQVYRPVVIEHIESAWEQMSDETSDGLMTEGSSEAIEDSSEGGSENDILEDSAL